MTGVLIDIDSYTASVLANEPALDNITVHSYTAMVSVSAASTNMKLHAFMASVMFRADHKPGGGRYPIDSTPNAEDSQLIYTDLVFPECIAYGTTGSPRYVTEKVEVDSGAEQRNQRRAYPRHEYNIVLDNIPANEISQVMNIWHVCAGDFIGFLFMDPLDHTSLNTEDVIAGSEVTMLDQFVASAVGTQTDYQLFKSYTSGAHELRRRIRYPDRDTLLVGVDGHLITSWNYSFDDQVLRFVKPYGPVTAPLSRTSGGIISGSNFSLLSPGDLVYVTGWSNGAYNAPEGGDPARVVTADAVSLRLEKYDGTAYGAAVFTGENVTIVSALPPTGAEITAGFYFHVPVRFEDGDNMQSEIKSGLRESAFATFSNITLREIFE